MSESQTEVVEGSSVKFLYPETITELLDGQVAVKSYPDNNLTVLTIGNTGLKVFLDKQTDSSISVQADFIPEDYGGPTNKLIKPSVIFGYALAKFYDFAKDPENLSLLKLNIDDIQKLTSRTNPIMIHFMKNMFGKYHHGDLIAEDKEGRVVVDWKGILTLEETDPLIVFIRKMEKRGEKTTVTYSKFA